MSAKKKDAGPSAAANPASPASLTAAQAQEWYYVLKKLDDNKWVVPAIITAGIAAVFESIHLIFLAIRFIVHWLQGSWSF